MKTQQILKSFGVAAVCLIGGFICYRSMSPNTNSLEICQARLTLQQTRQISQQIKYQLLIECANIQNYKFAEILSIMNQYQVGKIQEYSSKIKDHIKSLYEQRESIIIDKYQISKQDYANALNVFENDQIVKKNIEEIFLIMEKAQKGQTPDYTVTEQILSLKTIGELERISYELSYQIILNVWRMTLQFCQSDPTFDPSEDQCFKRVIRKLKIYHFRCQFLQSQGFKRQYGCPNENFFKIIELHKLKNDEFKTKMISIQKAYEDLINIVSIKPSQINQIEIKQIFDEKILINSQKGLNLLNQTKKGKASNENEQLRSLLQESANIKQIVQEKKMKLQAVEKLKRQSRIQINLSQ